MSLGKLISNFLEKAPSILSVSHNCKVTLKRNLMTIALLSDFLNNLIAKITVKRQGHSKAQFDDYCATVLEILQMGLGQRDPH